MRWLVHIHDIRIVFTSQSRSTVTLARARNTKILLHWILLRMRYVCSIYTYLLLTSFEALARFSELQDYEGYWPVGDIIQMQLKNRSAKERQKKK